VECSCPDHSDTKIGNGGKMCVPVPNNCTEGQFVCRNSHCISSKWLCDHDDDCKDGTDEDPRICGMFVLTPVYWNGSETICTDCIAII